MSSDRSAVPDPCEHVLAVAACSGERCRALRQLRHGDPATPHVLRMAVANRPDAALISTGCLGLCHLACVVAVGPAVFAPDGRMMWMRPPVAVALAERDERTAELARWVGGAAPDQLPEVLRSA